MKKAIKTETKKAKSTGRKTSAKPSSSQGLKKQYLKTHPNCKVTFRLPKEAAPKAKSVTVVGDFNNWDITETPLKKLKSGDFTVTLSLPCNREYKFRYLVDTNKWENDWFADKYIPNQYGNDDSVVVIETNGY